MTPRMSLLYLFIPIFCLLASINNNDSHLIMNGNFENISKGLIQHHAVKGYSEVEVLSHAFILWVLDGGEWSFFYRSHSYIIGSVSQRYVLFSVKLFELNDNSNGRTYIRKIALYQFLSICLRFSKRTNIQRTD